MILIFKKNHGCHFDFQMFRLKDVNIFIGDFWRFQFNRADILLVGWTLVNSPHSYFFENLFLLCSSYTVSIVLFANISHNMIAGSMDSSANYE